MGKLKLNLVSGTVIEKPIINAFSSNGNSYVVLDNEMNGSMGLPIILVSKIDNDKLVKIIDPNEWQNVKEYLKSIIAGGTMEYVKLNPEMPADDIYYTQLTLPVSSFDALKNAYKVEGEENAQAEEVTIANINLDEQNNMAVEPSVASNEVEPASVVTPEPAPVSVENPAPSVETEPSIPNIEVAPVSAESAEEANQSDSEVSVVAPIEAPVSEAVDSPKVEASPIPEVNTNEHEPLITPTPIIESPVAAAPVQEESKVVTEDLFKEQKEAFMQACENMFDALVQKFEKELENHKN